MTLYAKFRWLYLNTTYALSQCFLSFKHIFTQVTYFLTLSEITSQPHQAEAFLDQKYNLQFHNACWGSTTLKKGINIIILNIYLERAS